MEKPGGEEAESGPRHPGLEVPAEPPWSRQITDGGRRQAKWTQKCNKVCSKEWEGQDEFAKEEERVQMDWGGQHSEPTPVKGLAWTVKHIVVPLFALLSAFQMHLYGFM